MAYVYNAVTGKYFKGDTEITKEEYTKGIEAVKNAFVYALKIHNGEHVQVPAELSELVEMQLSALAANIPDEEEITDAEALSILLGGETA